MPSDDHAADRLRARFANTSSSVGQVRLAVAALLAALGMALGGCGGSGHATATSLPVTSPAPPTSPATATVPATAGPLRSVRCPKQVTLPRHGDYGTSATVFIVGDAPKRSGCGLVRSFVVDWIKSGATPGAYAAGRYAGFRCDAGLTAAANGPLGHSASRYRGVIHCAQVDESPGASPPELQLSSIRSGVWAYYRGG